MTPVSRRTGCEIFGRYGLKVRPVENQNCRSFTLLPPLCLPSLAGRDHCLEAETPSAHPPVQGSIRVFGTVRKSQPRAPKASILQSCRIVQEADEEILTYPILVGLSLLNLIKPWRFVPLTQKLMSILPCNWLISPCIHGIWLAKYISSPNISRASAFVRSAYNVLLTTELDCF